MRKILIIEDDIGISGSLKLYLESSEFDVYLHDEGLDAIEKINSIMPDIVILDINLPGKDGIQIIKEYKVNGDIPIVMLTARGSETDRITGLESGADDYIAKPFSPRELLARINGILKRSKSDNDVNGNIDNNFVHFKGIELDLSKKLININGKNISLTGNEFDILKKIIEEDGKIVTRETIMKEIIGYDKYIYDRTIDTHIKNIRKKIGNREVILTVRGEGYRLNK